MNIPTATLASFNPLNLTFPIPKTTPIEPRFVPPPPTYPDYLSGGSQGSSEFEETVSEATGTQSIKPTSEYYDEYNAGLDLFITPGFRVWMLIGIILGVLTILTIIVCCFVKVRIPRTRRQIEAMTLQRKLSKKGLPYPPNGETTAILSSESAANSLSPSPRKINRHHNSSLKMQSLEVPPGGKPADKMRSKTPQSVGTRGGGSSQSQGGSQYTSAEADLNELEEQLTQLDGADNDVTSDVNRSPSHHHENEADNHYDNSRGEMTNPTTNSFVSDVDKMTNRNGKSSHRVSVMNRETLNRQPHDLRSERSDQSGGSSKTGTTQSQRSERIEKTETSV